MKKSHNSNARDEEISQFSQKISPPVIFPVTLPFLSYLLTLSRWINAVEMVLDNGTREDLDPF